MIPACTEFKSSDESLLPNSVPSSLSSMLSSSPCPCPEGSNQSSSASPTSSPSPSPKMGTLVFVRHGESTANEMSVFAGASWDVRLTAFGRFQAERGAEKFRKLKVKFDEVHVSNMQRAKETMMILMDIPLPTPTSSPTMVPSSPPSSPPSSSLSAPIFDLSVVSRRLGNIPIIESAEISERGFGVWTRHNKNLLMKTYGYHEFEALLHSPYEAPLHGESLSNLFHRCSKYYTDRLLPSLQQGKNILLVAHQYTVEMFGLLLLNLTPEYYHDFSLPNAAPLTVKQLQHYILKEKSAMQKYRKVVNDYMIIQFSTIYIVMMIIGAVLKVAIQWVSPTLFLQAWVSTWLFLNSLFILLDADLPSLLTNPWIRRPLAHTVFPYLVKSAAGFVVSFVVSSTYSYGLYVRMALLWLMPPALTTPVLSQLWGGSFHLALAASFTYCCASPALVVITLLFSPELSDLGISILYTFLLFFFVGLIIPAILSQCIRYVHPVESKHFVTKYKFLGIVSKAMLAVGAMYHFTPVNLWDILTLQTYADDSGDTGLFFIIGIFIYIGWYVLKIIGRIASNWGEEGMEFRNIFEGEEEEMPSVDVEDMDESEGTPPRRRRGLCSLLSLAIQYAISTIYMLFTLSTHINNTAFAVDTCIILSNPSVFLFLALVSSSGDDVSETYFAWWSVVLSFYFMATDNELYVNAHTKFSLIECTRASNPDVIHQGWMSLLVQSSPHHHLYEKNPMKYFFVLTPSSLQYYTSPSHFNYEGIMEINDQLNIRRAVGDDEVLISTDKNQVKLYRRQSLTANTLHNGNGKLVPSPRGPTPTQTIVVTPRGGSPFLSIDSSLASTKTFTSSPTTPSQPFTTAATLYLESHGTILLIRCANESETDRWIAAVQEAKAANSASNLSRSKAMKDETPDVIGRLNSGLGSSSDGPGNSNPTSPTGASAAKRHRRGLSRRTESIGGKKLAWMNAVALAATVTRGLDDEEEEEKEEKEKGRRKGSDRDKEREKERDDEGIMVVKNGVGRNQPKAVEMISPKTSPKNNMNGGPRIAFGGPDKDEQTGVTKARTRLIRVFSSEKE